MYTIYDNSAKELLLFLNLTSRTRATNYDTITLYDTYEISDVSFEDYKEKMLEYISFDFLATDFFGNIKVKDGMIYYSDSYYSEPYTYELVDFKQDTINDNAFWLIIKENNEVEQYFIVLTTTDNKLVVDYFDYADNAYFYDRRYEDILVEDIFSSDVIKER